MSYTPQQLRLALAKNPWSVPPPEEGMRQVWASIGLSGFLLLAGVAIRSNITPLEIAARGTAFGASTSIAAYALLKSHSERQLDSLRDAHAAIREEISGSVLEASAEYYAQNIAAMMGGSDVPVQAIQGWFAREYGESEALPPAAATTTEPTPPAWFDWNELLDGGRHPHVLILAGSGCGKTTLLEWIARNIAPDGRPEVWTTKKKGDQWHGLDPIGIPRDFAAIRVAHDRAIATMAERFANLDADFKLIAIAWDEISACVEHDKEMSPASLLREAREADIRLVAAPHGGQVKSIGLEGKSDVLACCTQVRLGDLALDHARKLARAGTITAQQLAAVEQSDRPCMVGSCPAQVPHLPDGWQTAIVVPAVESNSPADIVRTILKEFPDGATVRQIQRTSLAKKHELRSGAISDTLVGAPDVESRTEGRRTVYQLTSMSAAVSPVPPT